MAVSIDKLRELERQLKYREILQLLDMDKPGTAFYQASVVILVDEDDREVLATAEHIFPCGDGCCEEHIYITVDGLDRARDIQLYCFP